MVKKITFVAGLVLLLPTLSFAHEGKAHGHHKMDPQMAKMHKMMPRYAKSQAKIDSALEKRDLATVGKEAEYLLTTTADLKKAKPHKHLENLGEFQKMAGAFEQDVKAVAVSSNKGDVEGAKASFSAAEKVCAACHAKFR